MNARKLLSGEIPSGLILAVTLPWGKEWSKEMVTTLAFFPMRV